MESNTVILTLEKYDYFMENERKLDVIIKNTENICLYRNGYSRDLFILNNEDYVREVKREIMELRIDKSKLEDELSLARKTPSICKDLRFSILNESMLFRFLNKFIFKVE